MRIGRGSFSRFDGVVLLFLLLSRVLLIVYVFPDQAKMFNGDSALYEGLAVNVLEHGAYTYAPMEPFSDLFRPPGYPLFILANYGLFGQHFLIPILWNLLGVVFIYLGLKRLLALLGERAHTVVLTLFALDLAWLFYSKELVTEPLFTPLLLWSIIFFVLGMKTKKIKRFALSALLLGLGALVKPVVLYLPVVLVPYVLVAGRRWQPALVYAAVFAVCVAPWFVRNLVVHDVLSFTYVQNDNLLYAHAAFVYADAHGLTHVAAKDTLTARLQARLPAATASYKTLDAAKGELARDVLADHPWRYGKAILRGVAITLFDPGRLVFNRTFPSAQPAAIGLTNIVAKEGVFGALKALLQENTATVVVLGLYLVFLGMVFGLAVLGVWPFFRADPRLFVLITLVTGYLLIVGGPNGYARFRLYAFPFLLVYAHFGMTYVQAFFHHRKQTPTALPA